ncbi:MULTISPECIES: MEKHLA domain-containing protein [Bacillales]|uniref:MEKHLA domain-containing protein n=1 Tax=Bacillales TaxID=1385 RepID=UPI0006A7BA23|nr:MULTISPECIES: MEKHLA domain-containing protein [Bacillales]OBZ13813.1 MEKHLA domain-containing protein [Bacillus sp. FJAT-26390]
MQLPLTGVGAAEEHARLLLDSYRRWTGKELLDIEPGKSIREQLFHATTVILSHGTEADPVLNYGNQKGLGLWEMEWETFTSTPSRLTAEPMERAERDRFFEAVTANGYVDNYTGIRISSTGRRFYIVNATVWNLADESGGYLGQAAAFSEYRYL